MQKRLGNARHSPIIGKMNKWPCVFTLKQEGPMSNEKHPKL